MNVYPKKTVLLALLLSIAALGFGQVGDNFARNSLSLGGNGSLTIDLDNVFNDANEDFYWGFSLSPDFHLFVSDGLMWGISPVVSYSVDKTTAVDKSRNLRIGITTGISYFFVAHPEASGGLIPSLGTSIGLQFYPGIDDLVGGVETMDTSALALSFSLNGQLNFFATERTAVYLNLRPQVFAYLAEWDKFNSYDFKVLDYTYIEFDLVFGILYFIPSRDRLQF